MKDHEKRELVNELTAIARQYGQTQQLRDRIAHCVLEAVERAVADERDACANRSTGAIAEVRRMRGEQQVLARLLGDALAVLRTIDPMDTTEMESLEGLMERAQKACDAILTTNVEGNRLAAHEPTKER